MAVLLNETSNLRLRFDFTRRLSDGVNTPASLELSAAIERYRHVPGQQRGPRPPGAPEHGFVPVIELRGRTVLDVDLIAFLESLEALLGDALPPPAAGAPPPFAALEPTVDPAIGVRVIAAAPPAPRLAGAPPGPSIDSFLVEVGVDLSSVLEPVAGSASAPGQDLALFRFFTGARPVLAFCHALIEEFAAFPTDPSKVSPGVPG